MTNRSNTGDQEDTSNLPMCSRNINELLDKLEEGSLPNIILNNNATGDLDGISTYNPRIGELSRPGIEEGPLWAPDWRVHYTSQGSNEGAPPHTLSHVQKLDDSFSFYDTRVFHPPPSPNEYLHPSIEICKLEAAHLLKENIEELLNNVPFPELILSGDFNMNLLGTELYEEAITVQNTFWQIPDQGREGD
ncbi:hypothetical protein NDU88_003543 [Pleurodeles waltl]|uniref:Endonuclease/exonuclease/phosphatase domain-containing protein n=1 Tax=Pleurodeles waltl TaxID=8319 RepID=A0AAV7M7C1_PLEWA|nr:hypothetical protein NDU88_003543 [Pleurodeles waltl]